MIEPPANLDRMFEALADPTRRAMIDQLSRGPASVSELAAPLTMSLPGVVQHLQLLEQSGLVRTQKVGRTRTCTIDTVALGQIEQWINDRRMRGEKRFDSLAVLPGAGDAKE